MWEIRPENVKELKKIKAVYYAERLDMTRERICHVLNGKSCKTLLAMALICICYNISFNDEQMNTLLEKHFSRIK